MSFGLYDDAAAGTLLASYPPSGTVAVNVTDGLFTQVIDFGANVFIGKARWVQVSVNGSALLPRQELTPAPYALALPGLYTVENATSPNIIGGYSGNVVTSGVVGATISGGGLTAPDNNVVTDNFGTVGGGGNNQAGDNAGTTTDRSYATVGGGINNTAGGEIATVGGGGGNTASGYFSTVGGGQGETASGYFSTVGGGNSNFASGYTSTIGGGETNIASGLKSTIGGGISNVADGERSTVGGGEGNISHDGSTIAGGYHNTANGAGAAIGGGAWNRVPIEYATVPGGLDNTAGGQYSLAAGQRAVVRDVTASGDANGDEGTFVWSDTTTLAPNFFTSTGPNQFLIKAAGGVGINKNNPQPGTLDVNGRAIVTGFQMASGAGAGKVLTSDASGIAAWQVSSAGIGGSGTANYIPKFTGPTAIGNSALYESGGNVGIGTPLPQAQLHVKGSTWTTLVAEAVSNDPGVWLTHDASYPGSDWTMSMDVSDGKQLQWRYENSLKLSVTTGGNVGIGTNAPLAALHVTQTDLNLAPAVMENDDVIIEAFDAALGLYSRNDGVWGSSIALKDLEADGTLNDTWGIARQASGTGDSSLRFTYGASNNFANNSVRMVIDSAGRVGIGTTLPPTGKLHVVDATGGDASVVLPTGAIGSAEIANEPGVASVVNNTSHSIATAPSFTKLESHSITTPAAGYVLVIATLEAEGDPGVDPGHIRCFFAVTSSSAAFPTTQRVAVWSDNHDPVSVTFHELFSVGAGMETFYLLGQAQSQAWTANHIRLTLVYFPTAYGTITSTTLEATTGGEENPSEEDHPAYFASDYLAHTPQTENEAVIAQAQLDPQYVLDRLTTLAEELADRDALIEDLETRNTNLETNNTRLEARLTAIEALLATLAGEDRVDSVGTEKEGGR
jgi:hypothetical protein